MINGPAAAALAAFVMGSLLTACGVLPSSPAKQNVSTYSLDIAAESGAATSGTGPSVFVSLPRAAAGYASPRIAYSKRASELLYYAHSEWVAEPARLLEPLLVNELESLGAFATVLAGSSQALAELRLDVEIRKLEHDFSTRPSRGHAVVRAQLVDVGARRVIASQTFSASVAAASENPYGGVVAMSGALGSVVRDVGRFCAASARSWAR